MLSIFKPHIVFYLAIIVGSVSLAYAQSEADYQQRLEEIRASISSLQNELKTAKDSKSQLQQSLQQSEEDISRLSKKVKGIKEALDREKKHLSQLQTQSAELGKKKQQQQQHIATIIRQIYRIQQKGKFQLLLSQQNPESLNRLVTYHDYIARDQQQKIQVYIETINTLEALQETIVQSSQQLEQHHAQLSKRQQRLKASQTQRSATLQQLNKQLRSKNQQLKQLNLDRQHLQRLIDEATQALADLPLPSGTTAFAEVKGQLPPPAQGKLLYHYGSSHLNGKLKRNGIFIRGKAGTNVISVHHGRVIFSDYLRGHGLLLIIDHGNGYMSLYGHNQTLLKATGEWVKTGEVVATVGNSGGQEYTGLYFEIRHNGQPQNPHRWLRRG